MFDLVIINDDLDKAYATLKQALSEVGPFPSVSCTSHPVNSANPVMRGLTPLVWCKQHWLCQLPDWSSAGAKPEFLGTQGGYETQPSLVPCLS